MGEEVTARVNGVQLHKEYTVDEFPLPTVAYEFESERADTATIYLAEDLPDELDPGHLAFHTELGVEHWQITDDQLVFEAEIGAQASLKSLFAVRPESSYDVAQFVAPPVEFTINPREDLSLRGSQAASRPTSDASTSQADEVDDPLSPDPVRNGDVGVEAITNADTMLLPGDPMTAEAPHTEHTDEEHPGSVADEFAAALQSNRISADAERYLAEYFGGWDAPSGSTDARLAQVQQDVADLRAYTSALEEFLDEEGSARELIGDVETRLDSVDAELDALDSKTATHETELTELQEEVQTLQTEVESLRTAVSSKNEELAALASRLDHIEERLPAQNIDERIATLEDQLDRMSKFTSTLQDAFQNGVREESAADQSDRAE